MTYSALISHHVLQQYNNKQFYINVIWYMTETQPNNWKKKMAINTIESSSTSHHFVGLRLSVLAVLVMTTMLLAGSGDAIDLMKLLEQKQRNFKRAGKFCYIQTYSHTLTRKCDLYNIYIHKYIYNRREGFVYYFYTIWTDSIVTQLSLFWMCCVYSILIDCV